MTENTKTALAIAFGAGLVWFVSRPRTANAASGPTDSLGPSPAAAREAPVQAEAFSPGAPATSAASRLVVMRSEFHLRPRATAAVVGELLPSGTILEMVERTSTRRNAGGPETLWKVRTTDSARREGWAFVPDAIGALYSSGSSASRTVPTSAGVAYGPAATKGESYDGGLYSGKGGYESLPVEGLGYLPADVCAGRAGARARRY